MSVDFNSPDLQLLLRQFQTGNAILFAGAGFSVSASNAEGTDPPTSQSLAERLSVECGWSYSGEELPLVYGQAEKHLGTRRLRDLMDRLFGHCTPADWHRSVAQIHWYRIYTTNVDDVIENSYTKSNGLQRLAVITCPAQYKDVDSWFEEVQCVHLHGSALDRSKQLTFTAEHFAVETARPSPWYQSLIEDMYSRSVVFIGSRLSEPPFHHYLQLRSLRARGTSEIRAKAFVVTPNPSRLWERQLLDQNMVVIPVTAEEFIPALAGKVSELVPDRMELLKARYPHQIQAIVSGLLTSRADLLRDFDIVDTAPTIPTERATVRRTQFFLGAEPSWDDVRAGVDAVRGFVPEFLDTLRGAADGHNVVLITGHAGSGKSTLLRRLAIELAREGRSAYFAKAPRTFPVEPVLALLRDLDEGTVYFFLDDAVHNLNSVSEILSNAPGEASVTFVLAERPHLIEARLSVLPRKPSAVLDIPPLSSSDCDLVIDKLSEFGYLGALQGVSRAEQRREFLGRSQKQLLVALKEATSGRGFDAIIGDEFRTLASDEVRMAYTIACLAYMHGAPIRRRHLLACIEGSDIEKGVLLSSYLRDVLVKWKDHPDFLCPRHRGDRPSSHRRGSYPRSKNDSRPNLLGEDSHGGNSTGNLTKDARVFGLPRDHQL